MNGSAGNCRRFVERGLKSITVRPGTVLLPFDFFQAALEERVAAAQQSGDLAISTAQLGS